MLYKRIEGNSVLCQLCAHNCRIAPGNYGVCNLRQNIDGELYTYTYGKIIASHVDPVEKKPLYHFLPGSNAFSIATPGCNFKCDFCQNWQISQEKCAQDMPPGIIPPNDIVRRALESGCRSIAYTYTEPTIFFEYVYDTARLARSRGLYNLIVTNGYMTREAIDCISPYLDAANIDLKSLRNDFYKNKCKARLEPVLDSIRYMKKSGLWIEVTTLIIPGLNDSKEELKAIAGFIAEIGIEIPWHISRFHPDYSCIDNSPTPIKTLITANKIGKEAGLRYIYPGNIAEEVSTACYECGKELIKRNSPEISMAALNGNRCAQCNTILDGVF